MAKSSQGSASNLSLETAPPRIIATHRRKSSEWKLDTIAEENAMVTFSESQSGSPTAEWDSSSPSVRQQRFGAELTRFAQFTTPEA